MKIHRNGVLTEGVVKVVPLRSLEEECDLNDVFIELLYTTHVHKQNEGRFRYKDDNSLVFTDIIIQGDDISTGFVVIVELEGGPKEYLVGRDAMQTLTHVRFAFQWVDTNPLSQIVS